MGSRIRVYCGLNGLAGFYEVALRFEYLRALKCDLGMFVTKARRKCGRLLFNKLPMTMP